ncbi:hypothetical protein L9F63_017139 [Diploptera punctata]|uniref:Uncharacterized protein n=1 Tax=Diploptera punctata TaxID=6984 RepID=A0AAD8A044_DIPPU|nr:hypothetical protein L9F63_017139 [Diploptera punctata]
MSKLSLAEAQGQFVNIMRNVDKSDVSDFITWIKTNWMDDEQPIDTKNKQNAAEGMLDAIADDLRNSLPLEAILPSENICPPQFGKNADCDPKYTMHVDAFLYNDELVDTLCDEGQLTRYYCTQCASRQIQPLTFISHSASIERLKFIFKCMLPPLDGKVVLDIGSRLGAVLYGAYVFSSASKIIGVELNAELCTLQKQMVSKYRLQERVQVVEADIRRCPDIVTTANVIIMNNVFEFFLSRGTLLVTIPSLEDSCLGIDVANWVEEIPVCNLDAVDPTLNEEEVQEIRLYRIK